MFKIKGQNNKNTIIDSKLNKIKHILTFAIVQTKQISTASVNNSISSPVKRKSDESSQAQSIAQIIRNLKKGYLMIKHSENTSQPHSKFVYISDDNRYLCWKSPDREDEKLIQITTICKVIKEGAQYYQKAAGKVKDLNCCVVVISTVRNLQLEAPTEIQAEIFKDEMHRILKYSKSMSLNYRYSFS